MTGKREPSEAELEAARTALLDITDDDCRLRDFDWATRALAKHFARYADRSAQPAAAEVTGEGALTIRECQQRQPWTVPYALGVVAVADKHINQGGVPHILGSHCALHAAKSVGKLAAVFEALDHPDPSRDRLPITNEPSQLGAAAPNEEQLATIMAMSADLMTAALRFANLYGFDLATELDRRVREKNGTGYVEDHRAAHAEVTEQDRAAADAWCDAVGDEHGLRSDLAKLLARHRAAHAQGAASDSAGADVLRASMRKLLEALESDSLGAEDLEAARCDYHAARMLVGRADGDWDPDAAKIGLKRIGVES